MSILLEALKKSAEQRQLGETPTISTPVEAEAGNRDDLQHWLPLSMMALSVILIAWFGWQQYRTQTGDASLPDRVEQVVQSADSERESTGKPAIDAPGDRRGRAEQGRAAASASEENQRTPVESFQAPKQEREAPHRRPPTQTRSG